MIKDKISVIFPVYNEEFIIEKTITDYYNEFRGKIVFEMIVKEDGSTDKTKEILVKLSKKIPIKLHMSDERKGYQWSVVEALKHAKHEWVCVVDSDYQYRPKDLWKLTPYMGTHDFILGKRIKRMDPWHRVFLSGAMNLLIRMLFGTPYRDIDAGYRLMKTKVVRRIAPRLNSLSYFTAELVVRAHYLGYKIIEVPVSHLKRAKGTTNVFKLHKIPKIVLKEFFGILKLKSQLRKRLKGV